MVTTYGMSEILGPLAYDKGQQRSCVDGGMPNARRNMSEETARAIDAEVKSLVEAAHENALGILRSNRELLESISQQLLKEEVIEGDVLREMLAQVKPLAAMA